MALEDPRGYIYIVHRCEHIARGEPIYKVGRTKNITTRMNEYPQGSAMLFSTQVHDRFLSGATMLGGLMSNRSLRHRPDVGAEYFEGRFCDVLQQVLAYVWPMCPFVPLPFRPARKVQVATDVRVIAAPASAAAAPAPAPPVPAPAPVTPLLLPDSAWPTVVISPAPPIVIAPVSTLVPESVPTPGPAPAPVPAAAPAPAAAPVPEPVSTTPVSGPAPVPASVPSHVPAHARADNAQSSQHRHFTLLHNALAMDAVTCASIQWPPHTRYVLWAYNNQTRVLRAYVEFSRPVRAASFYQVPHEQVLNEYDVAREQRRATVRAMADAGATVWDWGSWVRRGRR